MKVVLGLGTNVGNRLENLRAAIRLLKLESPSSGVEILKVSPLYESEALLPTQAPASWNLPFLNLALLCETPLLPLELLSVLKKTETQLGRISTDRWAPRIIDVDILMIEDFAYTHENLHVPHLALMERPFALLPLCDLVPHWRLPVGHLRAGSKISEMSQKWVRRPKSEVPYQTHRTTLTLAQAVGTVNVTPDSFSDGGQFLKPAAALAQSVKLLTAGAEILDIGAQSTRPGSVAVSTEEEWLRLEPVLRGLVELRAAPQTKPFLISVDTFNPNTAAQAIELGVDWINDQSGCDHPQMIEVLAQSKKDVVIMHHQDLPANRIRIPSSTDPVALVEKWANERIHQLVSQGIPKSRIIFDPGIGFGYTPEQTWDLFRRLEVFHRLGTRMLVGHSRKSFLTSITQLPAPERDLETTAISSYLVENGVDYLRIHNTEYLQRTLAVWSHLNGIVRYRP